MSNLRSFLTPRRAALVLVLAAPVALAAGFGGPGGHFRPHDGPPSPEQAREHIGMVSTYALSQVGADDTQQKAISAVLDEAIPTMHDLHEQGHDLRKGVVSQLTAEQLDEVALEALRQDAVDLFDRGTATAMGFLIEAAQVLTPEQRQALAAWHKDHRPE